MTRTMVILRSHTPFAYNQVATVADAQELLPTHISDCLQIACLAVASTSHCSSNGLSSAVSAEQVRTVVSDYERW